MTRPTSNSAPWPRLMRAETAAAYVDEKSVEAFRRCIGKLYPQPIRIPGKGQRWQREALDQAIDRLSDSAKAILDAAEVL